MEPGTRTVKVRIEVANEDYALKPDMFADVVLRRELGDSLFVPESAVLKAGERQIVFLDRGDGRLEPREIETGARVEGGYVVLSGLAESDKVVTSANFLIDSESSLKAALSSMGTAPPAGDPHAQLAPGPVASPEPVASPRARSAPPPKAVAYACPMHPEVTSARPGSCRICGHAARALEPAMTRAIIRWSAENRWVVLLATAALVLFAGYALRTIPVDAIPDLSDTQVIVYSRWDRSPDIVEDQVTYPIVTALLGAPKVKAIRGFSDFGYSLRLRHLRGRHRHLLGPQPRARVPLARSRTPSPTGVRTELGPGRHGRRLGLPVRPGGRHGQARAWPSCASFQDWYLRYCAAERAGRGRGGHDRRLREAVPGHRRPEPAAGLRPLDHGGRRRGRDAQQRGGRPPHRDGRARSTWCAGAGYVRSTADLEKIVAASRRARARRSCCATWPTVALGPEIRRGVARPRRRGRHGGRHRGHAPRRERARRHRARASERIRETHAVAARGRGDRHRPTTART